MTLTGHLHRKWDRDGAASRDRMRQMFVDEYGETEALKRETQIGALPLVAWRGKVLRTLRCNGDFGKGPHDMNVPEDLLWHLINLNHFLCPYHR